jgi:hypothetical protein
MFSDDIPKLIFALPSAGSRDGSDLVISLQHANGFLYPQSFDILPDRDPCGRLE